MKTKIWEKKLKLEKLKLSEEITNLSRDPPIALFRVPAKTPWNFLGSLPKTPQTFRGSIAHQNPPKKLFWGPPSPPRPPLCPYQDRFADSGHGLASGGGGEVDGKIGEPQNGDEGAQPPLGHEFLAVVVRRVVAEDRLHEFHLREEENWEVWGGGEFGVWGWGGRVYPPPKNLKGGGEPLFFYLTTLRI